MNSWLDKSSAHPLPSVNVLQDLRRLARRVEEAPDDRHRTLGSQPAAAQIKGVGDSGRGKRQSGQTAGKSRSLKWESDNWCSGGGGALTKRGAYGSGECRQGALGLQDALVWLKM